MLRWMSIVLGPIFAKEMVEMARRKRYYLNRVLYGLALLFTLFLVWDSYQWQIQREGGQSIRLMADIAASVFQAVSGVQYGAVFLFVPLFLCGVIAGEREERTLELLFTTRLRDPEIVLGKLTSRVAALVLLILCALPVMSLVMLFGGIDPEGLLRILASTLLAILYAGAHSIYFSAVTRSPMGALVRTYWWMAVWLLAVPAVLFILVAPTRSIRLAQAVSAFLLFVNPVGTFIVALEGNAYNAVLGLVGEWFFPLAFIVPAAWSGFLIWRAVCQLRQIPTPLLYLRWKKFLQRFRPERHGVPAFPGCGDRVRRLAERTWFGLPVKNPLWLRSRLTRVYDREKHIGRIQWGGWFAAGGFLLLLVFTEPRALGDEECTMVFSAPTWIGIAALGAILAGTSLVGDRRRGFLELVLTTPLAARQIIDGTLLAVWHHLRRIYWLPWALGLFFCLTGASLSYGVFCSLITASLFVALLVVHGTTCSLAARTFPEALVPTFLFPLLVTAATPFLMPLFDNAAGPILWAVTALALTGTWVWVRRRSTAAAVGSHFIAVHLTLVCLATFWTWGGGPHKYNPVMAINPAVWTIGLLDNKLNYLFHHLDWFSIWPGYAFALAVNLVWARWWVIRHFDRLAGRTGPRRQENLPPRVGVPVGLEREHSPAPALPVPSGGG